MSYTPAGNRYDRMRYNRCGRSGLKLSALSLGLWHNFGGVDVFESARALIRRAFDLGITHFDLANNYGPPPGSAEETWGRVLRHDAVTSALIGASRPEQLEENVEVVDNLAFTDEELESIDAILAG